MDILEPRVMVSVNWALRQSMVWLTLAIAPIDRLTACKAPSVSDVVSRVRRESIEWIACAAPSGQRGSQRTEPIVDGFGDRLARGVEGLLKRLETAVDGYIERFDLGVERGIEIGDRVPASSRIA